MQETILKNGRQYRSHPVQAAWTEGMQQKEVNQIFSAFKQYRSQLKSELFFCSHPQEAQNFGKKLLAKICHIFGGNFYIQNISSLRQTLPFHNTLMNFVSNVINFHE